MTFKSFHVRRAYFMAPRDLVVLVGDVVDGPIEAGMWLMIPDGLQGPAQVPLLSFESVQFADGHLEACLTFACHHVERYPLFEPVTLEGKRVGIRAR